MKIVCMILFCFVLLSVELTADTVSLSLHMCHIIELKLTFLNMIFRYFFLNIVSVIYLGLIQLVSECSTCNSYSKECARLRFRWPKS